MAKVGRKRLAREIVRLLQEQPQRKSELLKQVAAYLIQTKRAHQMHLLVNDIADELLESQKHLSADVVTAFGLNDASRQAVIDMLKNATGAHTVELTEGRDPSLLGGVVVRTANLELDASVKRQLAQLAGGMR